MKRIFSGIRPTGDIHLGNYLGAIQNWVELQHKAQENLFCIVDLHALTTTEESTDLAHKTRIIAAAYLAAGIDPEKSIIFPQSAVTAHCELAWILGCFSPIGWLNRMTQFKDKAGKNTEQANLGLLAYPVLMAADILAYRATHVPVGEDQKQHLELARDLAGAFNRAYACDYFPLPEPLIFGTATRVMSLRNGASKMSKSDSSDYSRLNMMDSADIVALKIRKAKTDMEPLPDNPDLLAHRPEAKNLLTIYAALAKKELVSVCQSFAGQTFSTFKKDLTDLVVETICPIGDRMRIYLAEPETLDSLLTSGTERARILAQAHMKEIHGLLGLLSARA